MSTYPQITIQNKLAEPVSVYDAFADDPGDHTTADYFGALTALGPAGAGADQTFAPIHGPISTYIVYDSKNNPVKRVFTLGTAAQSFEVDQDDLDVIADTQSFVKLMQDSPNTSLVQQFNTLIKGGKASAAAVNTFFQNSGDFKRCTYISYMLVVVTLARTPATQGLPPEQQGYSLSSLLQYMGFDWPAGLPDVVLTRVYFSDGDQHIKLGGQLNIRDVTFGDGVMDHVRSILPSETLRFSVVVNLEPGLGIGSTQLQCVFDDLTIPLGPEKLQLKAPTVSLSITPLFKFFVFEIKTTLPFSLFGSPTFNANIAMTIDNAEAEIGVTLDGNGHTLLTPPGIKGLHFDQFGVGMGLFFEPPGYVLGVQGQFHIGDGNVVTQLDDDTFALVCQLEGEVPNPLFLSFYVPRLGLDQVITLFTNQTVAIGVPVQFSDLSFHWAENPMEPVILPDGTLAPMGYGFSAAMDLFGLGFYADLALDLGNGVQGQAQLAPFALGPVLSLAGDGPGVTIKVDAKGNPIRNNTIPHTAAAKQAIDQAGTKQLVAPGGAQLRISTSSSPYFKLDARLSFLGFHDSIDASIGSDGIRFSLDYGGIIAGRMDCVLKDYHNFSGQFAYGPDFDIPLPSMAGISLGHLRLTAQITATLGLTTSSSDIVFSAAGGFDVEGMRRQIGPFDLDIHITALSDVLSAIEHWIVNNVTQLFNDLLGDARKWASAVYSNVILPAVQGAEYVINVLKNSFGVEINAVGDLLKGSAYALDEVAGALKNVYGAAASDVAGALNTAYGASAEAAAQALNAAGYAANDVAGALKTAYGATAQGVATVMHGIGYGAEATARALNQVFGMAPEAVNTALQGVGYAANQVKDAFEDIGGAFGDFGKKLGDILNPTHW